MDLVEYCKLAQWVRGGAAENDCGSRAFRDLKNQLGLITTIHIAKRRRRLTPVCRP